MSSLKDKKSFKIEAAAANPATPPAAVVIGRLVGIAEGGAPLVDFQGNPASEPVSAVATASYGGTPPGTAVALMFLDGDYARPLVVGLVALQAKDQTDARESDGRLILTATQEIVLQCGRASIILTRAGKVLVRGAYVSTRSSGVQRIVGASVQIN